MPTPFRTIFPLVLSLAPLAAQDAEFTSVLSVARTTWPAMQHIGVVCNYGESRAQIDALAASATPGSLITVVDARYATQVGSAQAILAERNADFLVLLPRDPIFREGSFVSTQLVYGLARRGMPSVGTSPTALLQGAVFSIGARTGNQLLVTDKLQGTVSVVLPNRTVAVATLPDSDRGVRVQVATLP